MRWMKANIFGCLLGSVLFLGALLWYLAAGTQNDDFVYLHEFIGSVPNDESFSNCEGSLVTTFQQVADSVRRHYFYWGNARLGSAILFLANLWPLWLTSILNSVALSTMFLLTLRLGLGRSWQRRPLACMLVCAALWWFLPWHEMMLANAFCINYIWASALCLWFLLLLLTRRGSLWALCLLGLIAGGMHEGLSFTLCVVLFIWCVQRLVRYGWHTRFMLPCIFFAIGGVLVTFSPAIYVRSGGGEYIFHPVWLKGMIQAFLLRYTIFTLTLVSASVAFLLLPRRKFRRWWRFTWPILTGAFISCIFIFLMSDFMQRALWMGYLLCLISLTRLCRSWRPKMSAWISRSVASVLLAVMACWMVAVGIIQCRLAEEQKRVEELYACSDVNFVYFDATNRMQLPWWALCIPITVYESIFPQSYHLYSKYKKSKGEYWHPDMRMVAVIPTRDSVVDLMRLPALPGTSQAYYCDYGLYWSRKKFVGYQKISFGDPAHNEMSDKTRRFPWWRLRQSMMKEVYAERNLMLYHTDVPVTEELRRRYSLPADIDTIYFYQPEFFTIPMSCYGLPVVAIDSIP